MRQIIFLLLISSIASGQSLGRYPFTHARPISSPGYDYTALVHWYPLIANYNDVKGTDHGTNNGTYQADSLINSVVATYFNEAEDDYVALGTGTNHGSSTFSAFGTCRAHSRTGNDGMYVGGAGSAALVINSSGNPALIVVGGNYATSSLVVPLGLESFVGWSYAQDRNKIRFYVNGNTDVVDFSDTFSAVSNGIGGISTSYNWDGLWQNVTIWNDSLTEADFDYYYNSGDFKGYEE